MCGDVPPHFLWVGASFDLTAALRSLSLGDEIIPVTGEEKERALRALLSESSMYVSNFFVNWLDPHDVRIERLVSIYMLAVFIESYNV
jgi:hypothetical protein